MSLLRVENLTVRYGAIQAVRGVSLHVEPGEVVAILGSNGAGKTTTLRAISGLLRPAAGSIQFAGLDLRGLRAHAVATKGLALCPEGRHVFSSMTVEENLDLGAYMHRGRRLATVLQEGKSQAYRLFPILETRRSQLAGTLSGGEQQMLAIARSLMARPTLLALDEPSMGLAPIVVKTIFRILREIAAEGATVLLVEQNARAALRLATRAYVLETGVITAEGPSEELLRDPRLLASYLGTD
ncbi:MAG TPA: ABC transporter ATP-binding protein [Chloroflexota bacterium]|nr:ABC transporter ATP-binding protein [Chloroflexota bacterium]